MNNFLVLLSSVIGFAALFKVFLVLTCGKWKSNKRLDGKTAIVTGSNTGIGKVTAKDLASRGAKVILACRNQVTANKAREEIINETGNNNVIVKKLDLCSQKSVREFAADILATEPEIHILVHNAGIWQTFRTKVTEDGFDETMATNHFNPFLLTHLLIDLLKKSAPSRIVVVASDMHNFGGINLRNLNPMGTLPFYTYNVSKRANVRFMVELSKRLSGTGVTVNALHPGLVNTEIFRFMDKFPWTILALICKLYYKTPEQGAMTQIMVAVSDELEGVSGKYFRDCKEVASWTGALNKEKSRKLWDETLKIVKLQDSDPKI